MLTNLRDRNGNPLRPGDRVLFQVSPRLRWASGTVTEDGRHIRSDYNGAESVPWPRYTQRAA